MTNDIVSEIVESKDFYALPQSIQLLYFHMVAIKDEQGICIPKPILEQLFLPDHYLYILIESGYIIPVALDEDSISQAKYRVVSSKKEEERKYNTVKQCHYINGILRNRLVNSYYDEKRGLSALFTALDMGADLERITCLCKKIYKWTQFVEIMEQYGINP